MLRLDAGRYPAGPDQVAVTSEVAATFSLRTGGIWQVDGRALRVTGMVENPQNLLDEFALAAPGQLSPPDQVTILLDATAPGAASFSFPAGRDAVARPSAASTSAAEAVLVLATLGLLFTGLVAVAGFTVMANRRLRALGMLGALGATDRHVRLVMLANGAVVGAAGMLTGAAIGLAGWIALVPYLETIAGHRIDRFSLPWPTIATAMVLAVATSIAAAWWPAQSAARIPIVAALSGRPPRPQPGRRFAVPGGLLLAAGLGFLAFADQNGGVPPLVIAGTLATTLGVLFLAPLGIAGLAALGRRSPIAVRLALRDLSRYQARSGAALAAISLAVGIAATIAIAATQAATQATEASLTGPNLPANQLIVYLSPGGLGGFIPEQSAAELPGLQARVNALAASLHAQNVLALESAVNPAASPSLPARGNRPAGQQPAGLVKVVPGCSAPAAQYAGQVYVATPALLQHYGIKPSSIDPAADILTSRTGLSGVQLASGAVHGCDYDSNVQYIQAAADPDRQPPHRHLGPQHPPDHPRTQDTRLAGNPGRLAHPDTPAPHRRAGQHRPADSKRRRYQHRDQIRTGLTVAASRLRHRSRTTARARRAGHDRRPDPQRDRQRPADPGRRRSQQPDPPDPHRRHCQAHSPCSEPCSAPPEPTSPSSPGAGPTSAPSATCPSPASASSSSASPWPPPRRLAIRRTPTARHRPTANRINQPPPVSGAAQAVHRRQPVKASQHPPSLRDSALTRR